MKVTLSLLIFGLGFWFLTCSSAFAAVSETTSYLRVNTSAVPANGSSQVVVTVTIKDSGGIPISDTGPISLNNTISGVTISNTTPSNATTDANGQCTFTIKSSYAGDDTITATCQGVTIRENILSNPSFERDDNSDSRPDDWEWNPNGSTTFVSLISPGHSGSNAVKLVDNSASAGVGVWQTTAVSPNTNYKFSCWKKEDYLEVYLTWLTEDSTTIYTDYKGFTNTDTQQYEYFECIKTSPNTAAKCTSRFYSWNGNVATAWFDDVRLQRIPTINFTASKLKITSSPFMRKSGVISSAISIVGVVNSGSNTDPTFSNTITLTSSSLANSYTFSSPLGQSTSYCTASQGIATFYYCDTYAGRPIITVSRSGLTEATQEEIITPDTIAFSSIPFTKLSIETKPISLIAKNADKCTSTGYNDTIILSTNHSSTGKFSSDGLSWTAGETTVSLISGQKTIYYQDIRGGAFTITAKIGLDTSTSQTQQNTVAQPIITLTKYQRNLRTHPDSGDSTTGSIGMTSGDTIEYYLIIKNQGTETAANLIITDVKCFDTSVYNPTVFISMDTSTPDSWTYSTDPQGIAWQSWGSVPSVESQNVKGLKWRINQLGIYENNKSKEMRFRVRVK